MYKLFLTLLLFVLNVSADVLLYEDDLVRYKMGDEWQKRSSLEHFCMYKNDRNEIVVVQLFRHRRWSQWHMKGMSRTKETFQKYFEQSIGGASPDTLDSVSYDEKEYVLTLHWTRQNEMKMVSKMKLTSFGCIAFHYQCSVERITQAEEYTNHLVNTLEIPETLKFVPEDITDEILENMGGGVAFVFLSIIYLMFSLVKRSQLRSRKLEKRLEEAQRSKQSVKSAEFT